MVGIVSYAAYVPYNRLERRRIGDAFGKSVISGEKAIASFDEDSITMGATAALECCLNFDINKLDGVYFASTTMPYKEKQCATVISEVLDCRREIRTADFSSSLRSGTAALLSALDSAYSDRTTLITCADCRLGASDGINELLFGDGAASLILGNKNVIAEVIGNYSLSSDFHDQWRSDDDIFVRSWEDRFAFSQAYVILVTEAAKQVMSITNTKPSDYFRIVTYAHSPRYQEQICKKLGFNNEQIQDGMFSWIGNSGAASPLLMLTAALEEASPGDKIMLISYGEGSDAIVFQVTDEISKMNPRPTLLKYKNNKKVDMTYEKYLRWRQLIVTEPPRRPRQERSSLPEYYRDHKKNFALYGGICRNCATPQFPYTRVCVKCQAVDQMDRYRFYGKNARIATYTIDYLSESLDPPIIQVVVDFEGGGRMLCELADCDISSIKINMPVKMMFRRLFVVDGIHTYFWKAVPAIN